MTSQKLKTQMPKFKTISPNWFLVSGFLFLVSFLLTGCGKKAPAVTVRPKIEEPVNTVPIEERAYVLLAIERVGGKPLGRELRLAVMDSKGASSIEYELEYQTGTSVQAGIGSLAVNNSRAPVTTVLLGSCSAGGACSYHEGVKGGTLLLRFKGSQIGNLKGEWSYYAPNNDGKYSSRDGKFQLIAPELKGSYTLIAQTMGLPEKIKGEIISGPYNLDTTGVKGMKIKDANLSMRLAEDMPNARLLWCDASGAEYGGSKCKEVVSSIKDKTLTATINSLGTYLAVK